MPVKVEERISDLERIVKDLAYAQLKTERSLSELSEELRAFQAEMRGFKDEMLEFKDEMREFKDGMQEFKNEMREFKNEMQEFKDEMREFKDGMQEFKNEMKEFKDEMQEFKDEMREDRKRMNKQWGDLANKMGTLVEDVVAPNIPRIIKEYFKCELLEDFSIRRRITSKRDPEKAREFDAIAVCRGIFFVHETQSNPKVEYVNEFLEVLEEIYDYFPEYKDRRLVPVFSSFYLPEDIVRYLSKHKIYALGMKDETMEILNPELISTT